LNGSAHHILQAKPTLSFNGSVPASPRVADRITLWRRVYETPAELSNRIDAETQGKIISAVHFRIPIVTPDEQRATRVRSLPRGPQKASRNDEVDERLTSEAEVGKAAEHAEIGKEPIRQAERGKNVESGLARPKTVEEFRTILVHLLHHTPFR
jgi:hypothetical protein